MYFTKTDNYILVVGDTDEVLFISNVDKCIETIMKSENPVIYDIDLSPNNDIMVLVGETGNITLIDIKSQKSVATMTFFDIAKKIQHLKSR